LRHAEQHAGGTGGDRAARRGAHRDGIRHPVARRPPSPGGDAAATDAGRQRGRRRARPHRLSCGRARGVGPPSSGDVALAPSAVENAASRGRSVERGLMFRFLLRVRYGDTDQMGFAYYANYLRWFEMARNEYLRDLGYPYARLEAEGLRLPVVEAGCRYLWPARYDDLLGLDAWIEAVSRIRVRFEYRIQRLEPLAGPGEVAARSVSRPCGAATGSQHDPRQGLGPGPLELAPSDAPRLLASGFT